MNKKRIREIEKEAAEFIIEHDLSIDTGSADEAVETVILGLIPDEIEDTEEAHKLKDMVCYSEVLFLAKEFDQANKEEKELYNPAWRN